jgi:hypothetical protein
MKKEEPSGIKFSWADVLSVIAKVRTLIGLF